MTEMGIRRREEPRRDAKFSVNMNHWNFDGRMTYGSIDVVVLWRRCSSLCRQENHTNLALLDSPFGDLFHILPLSTNQRASNNFPRTD